MCEKIFKKQPARRIDPCFVDIVKQVQEFGHNTISSCCGHKKYSPSILIRSEDNEVWEWFSVLSIGVYNPNFDKRHNKYYKRDGEGYYFIPDLDNEK